MTALQTKGTGFCECLIWMACFSNPGCNRVPHSQEESEMNASSSSLAEGDRTKITTARAADSRLEESQALAESIKHIAGEAAGETPVKILKNDPSQWTAAGAEGASPESNNNTKKRTPSYKGPAFRSPTTLAEKAMQIGLHRLPSDLGVYTCPIFLPMVADETSRIMTMSSSPSSEVKDLSNNDNDDKALEDAIRLRQQELHEQSMFRQHFAREYIDSMTPQAIRKLFVGLTDPKPLKNQQQQQVNGGKGQMSDPNQAPHNRKQQQIMSELQMLHHPVRTCIIRVRPDVLCGSVLDAVARVLLDEGMNGEILKKQGGHLRGIVPPTYREDDELSFRTSARHAAGLQQRKAKSRAMEAGQGQSTTTLTNGRSSDVKLLPPYIVDAQLCTKKRSKDCERVVVVRIFAVPIEMESEIPPTSGEPPEEGNIETFAAELAVPSASVFEEESEIPCIWDASRTLNDVRLSHDDDSDGSSVMSNGTNNNSIFSSPAPSNRRHGAPIKTPSTAQKIGSILSSPKAMLFSSSKKSSRGKNLSSTHNGKSSTTEGRTFPSMSNKVRELYSYIYI
jgi:hypothetical protein